MFIKLNTEAFCLQKDFTDKMATYKEKEELHKLKVNEHDDRRNEIKDRMDIVYKEIEHFADIEQLFMKLLELFNG